MPSNNELHKILDTLMVAVVESVSKNDRPTREYNSWGSMKQRCYNPNNDRWQNYGGKGIKICDRWLHSFPNFLEDMGFRPDGNYSIDRIDPNGDYEPGNCRWATQKTQQNNRTNCRMHTQFGMTMNVTQWAAYLGMNSRGIRWRLNNWGSLTNENKGSHTNRKTEILDKLSGGSKT